MFAFARATLRVGEAHVIKHDGKIVAVSLVLPPRAYPLPVWMDLVIVARLFRSAPRRILRFGRVDMLMRKRHAREPHFYLWALGVEPDQQGRGHGSALLHALDARADAAGAACYLETDKSSSVRLYQKHAYVVQSEEQVPVLDFRFWFMLRGRT